jgi:hypothetical protein
MRSTSEFSNFRHPRPRLMSIVANGRIDVVRYTTTSIQFPDTLTYLLTRTCDPVTLEG